MEIKTVKEFNNKITEPKLTVIDFFAEWCGPCKMLAPVFASVESEMGSEVNFIKVNIDLLNEIASTYDVQSIPTIVFVKNNEELARYVGFIDSETLRQKIASLK